jgi:hypothetical protein
MPIFAKFRIMRELNRIKRRYQLAFANPHKLSVFMPIEKLSFPYLASKLYLEVIEAHKRLLFSAGMIDQLSNGQSFFLGVSAKTLEWVELFIDDKHEGEVRHYRFNLFEDYWHEQKKPHEAVQINATINIYSDEIFYLIVQNSLFSPVKKTLKFPTIKPRIIEYYQILKI